jgi:hypothetical protein
VDKGSLKPEIERWVSAIRVVREEILRDTTRKLSPTMSNVLSLDLREPLSARQLSMAIEQLRRFGMSSPEDFESQPMTRRCTIFEGAVWQAAHQTILLVEKVFPPDGRPTELDPIAAYEIAERSLLENRPYLRESALSRLENVLPRMLREARDHERSKRYSKFV